MCNVNLISSLEVRVHRQAMKYLTATVLQHMRATDLPNQDLLVYLAAARVRGFCRVKSHHNVLSKYLGSCLWESYQNFTRRQGHHKHCIK